MVKVLSIPFSRIFLGIPCSSTLIFLLIASMTSIGLAPNLETTTPPTTSAPSLSKIPLRISGPMATCAMSLILKGTSPFIFTTAYSRSVTEVRLPNPLIRYSILLISIVLAPTSLLAFFTALTTWSIDTS